MSAKTYARVEAGQVMELMTTAGDVTQLFHPSIEWVDVTAKSVLVGQIKTPAGFVPPPQKTADPQSLPCTNLQAELSGLKLRVAALEHAAGH